MIMISGLIILWYGAIGEIPSGFVICDGTNGTPDLRDKFIVGAGTTYAVGDSGGSVNHNHTFTGDGHSHSIGAGATIGAGANLHDSTSSDPATGTTGVGPNLPPYHALVYIQKT